MSQNYDTITLTPSWDILYFWMLALSYWIEIQLYMQRDYINQEWRKESEKARITWQVSRKFVSYITNRFTSNRIFSKNVSFYIDFPIEYTLFKV
jgi:hypothetical protein